MRVDTDHGLPEPTPDLIVAARLKSGLTQSAAAALVHASLRGWQDWEYGKGKKPMPLVYWELFLRKTGQYPFAMAEPPL